MTGRHRAASRVLTAPNLAVADVLLGCCAGLALVGTAVAPDAHAAGEGHYATAPEVSPEPSGHGGPMGPLEVPSIGVVAPETDTLSAPVPTRSVRTSIASNPTPEALTEALRATTIPSEPTVVPTPTPTASEPTQAATTTPPTETAATTTTEETATEPDDDEAKETDVVGELIEDVTEEEP